MARAHCMLDTYRYRHTLRICSTYCFSTATMVARPRLNVTLHVHCLLFETWLPYPLCRTAAAPPLSYDVPGLCPESCFYTSVRAPGVADRPVTLRPPHRKIRTQNHRAYPCLEWDSKPYSRGASSVLLANVVGYYYILFIRFKQKEEYFGLQGVLLIEMTLT
jgi:hypothetical protein